MSGGFDLKGKVCVVTGAAAGIGRSFCFDFGREQCKAVVVSDVAEEKGHETVKLVKEKYPELEIKFIYCDVSKEEDIKNLLLQTSLTYGGVDVFVGNAGVVSMGGILTTDEEHERCYKINVLQNVWAARALIPNWLESNKPGCIIITSSAAGLLSQVGSLAYAMTKRTAVSLAEFLAITYGQQGIQVTCLCPQAVRTDFVSDDEDNGVAAIDGILEPADVTLETVNAVKEGRFLVALPDKVHKYIQGKTMNYDRWIKGMQRLNSRF